MGNPFLIRSGASSASENSFPEGTPASAPQPAGVLFPQPALPGASSPGDTPASSSDVPEPVSYRSFGDIPAVRQAIFDRIRKAASGLIPVENNRYSLTLGEVRYEDRADPEPEEIKRAVLAQDSLTKALKGTWTLTDKLNGTVSRRKTVVAKVPYLLDNVQVQQSQTLPAIVSFFFGGIGQFIQGRAGAGCLWLLSVWIACIVQHDFACRSRLRYQRAP
jgi:hypothetical protein